MVRKIDIQNSLRLLGRVAGKQPITFEGDLIFIGDKFAGRTQDLAEQIVFDLNVTFASGKDER